MDIRKAWPVVKVPEFLGRAVCALPVVSADQSLGESQRYLMLRV